MPPWFACATFSGSVSLPVPETGMEGLQAGLQAGDGRVQGRVPGDREGEARVQEGLQEAREAVRAVDGVRAAGAVLRRV